MPADIDAHQFVSQQKPLVTAIKTLIAGGLVFATGISPVRAEHPLPTPTHIPGSLTDIPIDLVQGTADPSIDGQATGSVSGHVMTIHQLTNKVTLDWNDFNIDKGYTVNFQQPSTSSVALNNISDQNASQIFGTLTANGQVYLVNQNGFVFGPDSQVNVNSLVASDLGISQTAFQAGISNVYNNAVIANATTATSNGAALNSTSQVYLKDAQGNLVLDNSHNPISITLSSIKIDKGAHIQAAKGGLVLIAAADIENKGSIDAPNGQVILAAAKDKVYLQDKVYASDATDMNLRGMLVEIGTGGTVSNDAGGKIVAQTGNLSLIGFAVNQDGIASATTSVLLNGSVKLMAHEGVNTPAVNNNVVADLTGLSTVRSQDLGDGLGTTAKVTLGKGSFTSVDLDADKSTTAAIGVLQPKSDIEISGYIVDLQNGSKVQAHSGQVGINAIANVAGFDVKGKERIYLDKGSSIDVSGVKNVEESVNQNFVSIKLQSNELRNSPLQHKGTSTGILYGQTVNVDTREATLGYDAKGNFTSATVPLADISGSVQGIVSNIDQRSTTGGTIKLASSGDIIANSGSTLDFSGGSIAYQAGTVTSSELVSGNQIYDFGQAPANLIYSKILSQTAYIPGYVQGSAGGQLNVSSYAALLDGKLDGHTVQGPLQRNPDSASSGASATAPQDSFWATASSLSIDLINGSTDSSIGNQDVVFGNANSGQSLGLNTPIPDQVSNPAALIPLYLNVDTLRHSKVGHIALDTNGGVTLNAGASLDLPDAGQLNLTAQQFNLLGDIHAPSGSVTLTQKNVAGTDQAISLGASALIDVSGFWINDWLDIQQGNALNSIAINGGSVNLVSQGNLIMEKGSRIAADAGAWASNNLGVSAGKGGSISLTAGDATGAYISSLILHGDQAAHFSAWGLQQDGSLTLKSDEIVISNQAGFTDNKSVNPLVLSPDFFQSSGFSSYTLVSNVYGLQVGVNVKDGSGLQVPENLNIDLQQHNRQLDSAAIMSVSGSHLQTISTEVVLPAYLRNPDSLTLSYTELNDQKQQEALTIGNGAKITTDAGGSVALNSDTSIYVDGGINTPAGNISLNITLPVLEKGYFASQEIWLGANSHLSAAGVFVPKLNAIGLTSGSVLPGGNVELTAKRGYIVTEHNSVIDVSGTAKDLNFIESTANGSAIVTKTIASAGGNISFTSGEGIIADGKLEANSGGTGAAGGRLAVSLDSGLLNPPNPPIPSAFFPNQIDDNLNSTLVITTNDSSALPSGLVKGADIPLSYAERAYLKNSLLNSAGFDSISLQTDAGTHLPTSAIQFDGNVALKAGQQIILDSPLLQTLNSQSVTLDAPYVALGSTLISLGGIQNLPDQVSLSGAGHQFSVINAQGIDLVGGLGFNGFGQVNLQSSGDVRFRGNSDPTSKTFTGTLNLAGELDVTATRVYPATLSAYTINATDTVTFKGNGVDKSPVYSAGGNLTVNAVNINQLGTLEAPFGGLNLNATNNLVLGKTSVTSVSGNGSIVPFGIGSLDNVWAYPIQISGALQTNLVVYAPGGVNLPVTDNLPVKSLKLYGNSIDLNSGATVDLSGGGDLYAYQFISGSGGSNDVLNTTVNHEFAVLPGIDNILTPYDPQQYSASGLTTMGESVYLNAAAGLAAGWYTVLPAHYALLPGAYLITPESATQDQYQTTYNSAGVPIVSGYYGVAGTGIQNVRTQGFEVQPGSIFTGSVSYDAKGDTIVNTNPGSPSQFSADLANSFFKNLATQSGVTPPQLPQDAGSLLFSAGSVLNLGATLFTEAVNGGVGAQEDISANNLVIVGNQQDLANVPAGSVGLLASQVNDLKAGSLLLGGKRSQNSAGQLLTITAGSISVTGDAVLKGHEIMLAGIDSVNLSTGAQVLATGEALTTSGGTVVLENNNGGSDGALLRVSAEPQISISRDQAVTGSGGVLAINSGAVLSASASMLFDTTSTQQSLVNGTLDMTAGSLAINANGISLGSSVASLPAGTPGLQIASSIPSGLDSLNFKSSSDLDIYGSANLNAKLVNISAAAINGFNNDGLTSTVTAKQIDLANNYSAVSQHSGSGSGELTLKANNLLLGSGDYAINGFQSIGFTASQAINGLGATTDATTGNTVSATPGVLTVAGNLTLNAAQFSGGNGATTTINAGMHKVTLLSTPVVNPALPVGLGVSWSVSGSEIDSSARFDLPAGSLSMVAASGDINLQPGGSIDLSGRSTTFINTTKYSPAGNLSLTANQGNVNLNGGNVNLAGVVQTVNGIKQQVSNAGSMTVNAGKGLFTWSGGIDATGGAVSVASGVTQGNLNLNVSSFGADKAAFSTLNNNVFAAGFTGQLSLELQKGDINIAVGDTVKAEQVALIADQGAISLDGKIDVSGPQAGSVSLYGENGITLAATGVIAANSTTAGNAGGSVTLDTVHRTDAGTGLLDMSASNGVINLAGGTGGAGGSLHLRTGRDLASNVVSITAINTSIQGADPTKTVLEATSVYANTGDFSITSSQINAWQTQTADFMNHVAPLSGSSANQFELLPGIQVSASGNLTLASTWDFMSGGTGWSDTTSAWNSGWRYGKDNVPGYLTLRSAGDLNINASLSDGLANTPLAGQSASPYSQDVIQPGRSWSYNLIAGGNVNLAATYNAGNPLVKSNLSQVVVRTGTGNIAIQSGQDIVFNLNKAANLNASNNASAVYTVGTTALYTTDQLLAGSIPGLPVQQAGESLQSYVARLDQSQLNQLLRYGLLDSASIGAAKNSGGTLYAEYPTAGGSISLNAGGNIQGQQTGQQMTNWLVRSGNGTNSTAWGINISGDRTGSTTNVNGTSYYNKGSRNFNQNVGSLAGGAVTVTAGLNISDLSVMAPSTGKPLGVISDVNTWAETATYVNQGGNLQVSAGENIVGGEYYAASGTANLYAGDSIAETVTPVTGDAIGVILDVGNAAINVQAREDINLATVMNPTMVQQPVNPIKGLNGDSLFYTYGANSAVNLQSIAGNLLFLNQGISIEHLKGLSSAPDFNYFVYPAIVSAVALSGDIRLDTDSSVPMTLFPSKNGSLQLLAGNNIGTDANSSSQNITLNMSDADPALQPSVQNPIKTLNNTLTTHALIPVHQNDTNKPLIVANQGNIEFPNVVVASLTLPQASDIVAAGDIKNLAVYLQNIAATDVSQIKAGGSIIFDTPLDSNGLTSSSSLQSIQVAGPGQLQLAAGNSIVLGSSNGVQSVGNRDNSSLSATGASLQVLVGLSDQLQYSDFINKYQQAYPELSSLANLDVTQQSRQLSVFLSVLAKEINKALNPPANATTLQRALAYQGGLDAVQALFPSQHYIGDLGLLVSQINTLAANDTTTGFSSAQLDQLAGLLNKVNSSISSGDIAIQPIANLADRIDYAGFLSQSENIGTYLGEIQNLAGMSAAQQTQQNKLLNANFKNIIALENQALTNPDRQTILPVLLNVVYNELTLSLNAAASAKGAALSAAYQRGLDAIHSLFPGGQYEGGLGYAVDQVNKLALDGNISSVKPADYSHLADLFNSVQSNISLGTAGILPAPGWIDYAGFINKYAGNTLYNAELQGMSASTLVKNSRELDTLLTGLATTVNQLETSTKTTSAQKQSLNSLLGGLLQNIMQLGVVAGDSAIQQSSAELNVLSQELKLATYTAALDPGKSATLYQYGTSAVSTWLPGSHYSGDLSMVFSQVKTLNGGDINLFTPGGQVDVGLAGAQAKSADQLGILVQAQGDLTLMAKNNINVNQSRVFDLAGGDVTIWSQAGNIDAGNGAKSAFASPPPVTTYDANGNAVTTFPAAVSGSGIQALNGGNAYLAAPKGVVNAGEAGISGGQVVIAATAVIGASNISATGGTVGVPTAVVAPVVGGADSAAAGASKAAAQSSYSDSNNSDDSNNAKSKNTVTILSTDVVGFGKCSVSDVKNAVNGCGS